MGSGRGQQPMGPPHSSSRTNDTAIDNQRMANQDPRDGLMRDLDLPRSERREPCHYATLSGTNKVQVLLENHQPWKNPPSYQSQSK